MRLAVVSPFLDRRHGTERAMAELLHRLARQYCCQIHLYSQRVEDLALDDVRTPQAKESGAIFWHRVPSVPGPHIVQFLGWLALNGWLRWWHGITRRAAWDLTLSPGINCLDADVVIVHALFHRLREVSGEKNADSATQPGLLRRLHRFAYYAILTSLERRVYSKTSVSLAAVSPYTAKLLAKYFHRSDISVIPNGVDTGQFSPALRMARRFESRRRRHFSDADFVLLLIGNDWNTKGLPAILAALAACPQVPWQLVVAGNDSPDTFRAMAQRLGVLGRCHWERSPEVTNLYAAADLYVSPSREDSFGLPVAEAMACGLPVITSACAGVSALMQDGVDGLILADPRDTVALARFIQLLYEQTDLRERVGAAAAHTAAQWTWDRNAAAVWELLGQSIAAKAAQRAP